MTLNTLRKYRLNPEISECEQVDGVHNFECAPLAPLVCKLKIYEKPHKRHTYTPAQYLDGTLDHKSIIIDDTPDTILTEEETPHQIK